MFSYMQPCACSRVVVAAFLALLCCVCIWPASPFAIIALAYAFKVRLIFLLFNMIDTSMLTTILNALGHTKLLLGPDRKKKWA